MKIVSFSVSNFRSITKAHKISVSNKTVLLGKNNEGKSNLLKALNIGMNLLIRHGSDRRLIRYLGRSRYFNEKYYVWERDYPLLEREHTKNSKSTFRFEFELSDDEKTEFRNEIGSIIDGKFGIEILIGEDEIEKIKVVKKGANFSKKSKEIAKYIISRIQLNYIPAVRTDKESADVIRFLVEKELSKLETNSKYISALETITKLQKPILEDISKKIQAPLQNFLPSVNSVEIVIEEDDRKISLRRNIRIIIDDGVPTPIEFKGDGVKSLAAIGLLQQNFDSNIGSIILLEEPESHLHPGAIHSLLEVLDSLSLENQVLISTHNPLFIDRNNIANNIIVDKRNAIPAKDIASIRKLLGVQISDNLVHSRFVLLVEGEEDKLSLYAILSYRSQLLKENLENRNFVIESMNGTGNLTYHISMLKNNLSIYHIYLDHDEAGKTAYEKALELNLVTEKDITFITCNGKVDSEFEDMIDPNLYRQMLIDKYNITLGRDFRTNKKWSVRMRSTFLSAGRPYSKNTQGKIKYEIADLLSKNVEHAISINFENSIVSLITTLEKMLAI
jgi:predicted ATPase